ncbi:MAG: glucose dehydrogenase [Chloroflexi bacterium]|nr:MAG: glucose dehydrogenase [Chloroflexota bacterium]
MSNRLFMLGATFLLIVLGVGGTAVSARDVRRVTAVPTVNASFLASGFSKPTDITHAGDNRLFVAEQDGYIKIIDENGSVLANPFLDINILVDINSERGLLGLTFHPDYPTTPYFYVNYTAKGSGDTIIDRFSVTTDPNLADVSSRQEILRVAQPQENHNAGDLAFGPDGYLYITMGDGGGGGDNDTGHGTVGNGQERQTLLGKILRIDADNGTPYTIPNDNPFVGDNSTLDEIWALGLRNPWRFSFDRETGDLYIADVGQGAREEVNFQPASSSGGENYGWRCYEGFNTFNTSGCGPSSDYVFPIDDYPRSNITNPNDAGTSITGGFVYRGSDFPDLNGYYIYADFINSNVWLAKQGSPDWEITPIGKLTDLFNPSTFGEGCDGELYVAAYSNGSILQIQTNGSPPAPLVPSGAHLLYLPMIMDNHNSNCR